MSRSTACGRDIMLSSRTRCGHDLTLTFDLENIYSNAHSYDEIFAAFHRETKEIKRNSC